MLINYDLIGERVKEHRLKQHRRQDSLAWEVEISTSYLSCIENGKKEASLCVFERLAVALKLSLQYLLFGEHNYDENNYIPELVAILNGCTKTEYRIIIDSIVGTAKAVKHSLHINGFHLNTN